MAGKWLEIIKEAAPSISHIGLLHNRTNRAVPGLFLRSEMPLNHWRCRKHPIGPSSRGQRGLVFTDRLRYGNQSRYLAGIVSGIAAHSKAVATAETAARIRKPSQWPRASKRKPVAVVLIEAAMAIRVPTAPRTKLNRPVPVVRSVITRIVSTVTAAALMPPSN